MSAGTRRATDTGVQRGNEVDDEDGDDDEVGAVPGVVCAVDVGSGFDAWTLVADVCDKGVRVHRRRRSGSEENTSNAVVAECWEDEEDEEEVDERAALDRAAFDEVEAGEKGEEEDAAAVAEDDAPATSGWCLDADNCDCAISGPILGIGRTCLLSLLSSNAADPGDAADANEATWAASGDTREP